MTVNDVGSEDFDDEKPPDSLRAVKCPPGASEHFDALRIELESALARWGEHRVAENALKILLARDEIANLLESYIPEVPQADALFRVDEQLRSAYAQFAEANGEAIE